MTFTFKYLKHELIVYYFSPLVTNIYEFNCVHVSLYSTHTPKFMVDVSTTN